MRDPLGWVPVKYKLPLTFVSIGLVAFGVGGVVVTSTAREALERQIRLRLDEHAASVSLVLDRHLDLLGRRVEDFASDGFIRAEAAAGAPTGALARHLRENKLPLVPGFAAAAVLGADGSLLLGSLADAAPPDPASTRFGALRPRTPEHPFPGFLITTPLRHLDENRRIGWLRILVRADRWIEGMSELAALPEAGVRRIELVDGAGARLPLRTGGGAGGGIAYGRPVPRNGWRLELEMDRDEAMRPLAELRDRYLAIGGVLLLLTACVLFFPFRFLLRPLGAIREAARRIAAGDFATRVREESQDEIGDLARAFNIMAQAVEERTRTLERREGEIREERDRLAVVFRSMEEGLFLLDREGRVSLSNAAAAPIVRAFGPEGRAPHRIDCLAPERSPLHCLRCLIEPGRPARACTLEHEGRVYEVHATPLPSAAGAGGGHLCVSRDITARIAEGERQSHQERMAVLGEVAAVMAHELNNPLAAISMFSQMLEGELAAGSPQRERAEVIRRNTETCKRTIRGLLDMAARATPEVAPFDADDLLHEVARLLRPVHERAGVELRLRTCGEGATVVGDELQLRQVLINLVMNAIQALEPKGGVVTLSASSRPDGLEIRIEDDGPGIPEPARPHIFEPFFTTKRAGVGTGLGLPTSRRIVEAHGGTLDLVSTGPQGSVFRVVLPRDGRGIPWEARTRVAHEIARKERAGG